MKRIRKKYFLIGILSGAIYFISFFFLSQIASANSSWSNQKSSWTSKHSQHRPAKRALPSAPTIQKRLVTPFSPGSNNLSLDIGQVFLMGDLAEDYSDNIGTQVHYSYGVSDLFAFDTSLGISSHSQGNFSMGSLTTGLRTNLAWYDKVVPYAIFGLGFYRPNYQITTTSNLSPILFGVHLGAGVDLEISNRVFFGASLTFHDIFSSTRTIDGSSTAYSVGGTYISFLVRAGVTF